MRHSVRSVGSSTMQQARGPDMPRLVAAREGDSAIDIRVRSCTMRSIRIGFLMPCPTCKPDRSCSSRAKKPDPRGEQFAVCRRRTKHLPAALTDGFNPRNDCAPLPGCASGKIMFKNDSAPPEGCRRPRLFGDAPWQVNRDRTSLIFDAQPLQHEFRRRLTSRHSGRGNA